MNDRVQKEQLSSDYISLKILAFGIAKDVIGGAEMTISIGQNTSVGELKQELLNRFPRFGKLASLALAVNNEYAEDTLILKVTDEVVIIPPVSGG